MRFRWFCGWVLLVALAFCGCTKPDESSAAPSVERDHLPTRALPRLRTVKLWLGSLEITAEIARTPVEIETGMMFRTNLVEMEGMLFVLRSTGRTSFWMKNCIVPLSVAYIDPEGFIQEIHDLEPGNTNPVKSSSSNVRFALEVNQGWFTRHGITTGMVIRAEQGSLAGTFLRGR